MKKKNPRKVTEDQIKTAVKNKYNRMKEELARNPHNVRTSQRVAEFKAIHASKLSL